MLAPSEPRINPTRRDPPRVGTLVGEYRLCEPIGSGGLSWVFRAERMHEGPSVAVKFLRGALVNLPGFVRRFEREAEICRRLDHPACVRLHDFGLAEGIPYLVMELVDGVTLVELMRRQPIDPAQAISITRQVCTALSHAHQRSVVHRDLKPGNIMVTAEGQVKVVDFGTAQLLGGPATPGSGTDVGSPSYMAPEQISGQPIEPRTDLYALGVILFELLSGQRPFAAESPMRVLQMHLSCPIPSARMLKPEREISPELEGVIVRAMQKAPKNRFVDAASFAAALASTPECSTRSAMRSLTYVAPHATVGLPPFPAVGRMGADSSPDL